MEELKKGCAVLKERDINIALLSSHENITYVSWFDAPVQIGAGNDFSYRFGCRDIKQIPVGNWNTGGGIKNFSYWKVIFTKNNK